MRVDETELPGVGVRHDFTTAGGLRLGVLSRRTGTGRKQLLVYDRHDPDSCAETIALDGDEARALADLLAPNAIAARLGRMEQEVEGIAFEWVPIGRGSPAIGRTIAETAVRAETGATIVVVRRGDANEASPDPAFRLEERDMVIVVGAPHEVAAADRLLRGA